MIPIVGLCGVARSGKDTFFKYAQTYLKERYNKNAVRFAFADALKADVNDFLTKKVGISAFTQNFQEKELIRPMLVAYGSMMRQRTAGAYWVDIAKKELEKNLLFERVSFITDVRYENEYEMIKEKGGICVHLKRIDENGGLVKYANEEEERNDPVVESRSEVNINWGTYGDKAELYLAHIVSFIDSYFNEN